MDSVNDTKQKSVEAKKKKVQKSLKNILASPHVQYWSPIQNDDLKTLHECLEKNLPALQNLKSRISWKYLKKLSKEDRTKRLNEKKEKIRGIKNNQLLFLQRSYLTIGLNETSRYLSQDELSCIVVDGNSRSKRIAVFLVNISFAKHVPVIICPALMELTLRRFGFKTIVFGIKKNVNDSCDNMKKLISLQDTIVRIFTRQLSTEPILCTRFKRILADIESNLISVDENTDNDRRDDTIEGNISERMEADDSNEAQEKLTDEIVVTAEVALPENMYRYRTDRTYRVFVPQASIQDSSSRHEGFISVTSSMMKHSSNKTMVSMQKVGKKRGGDLFSVDTGDLVKPPVVKKVKPNPRRANTKVKRS